MKEKQQVMHIHGGEPWATYEDYLKYLKSAPCNPLRDTSYRWSYHYKTHLKEEYEIWRPVMPCKQNAHYNEWVIWFERHIEFMREGVILVGHSLGGNFLAKYLSEHSFPLMIKQLHLVAASYSDFEDDFKITEFPKNFHDNNISEIHIYHSSDDPVVSISESKKYAAALPEAQFHSFDDRGHFLEETFTELFENIKTVRFRTKDK